MKQVELEQTLKQRVEDVVKQYYNGSVNKFATALGIRQTTLNDQINGKSKISAAALLALLDVHPDISAEWLLRGDGPMYITEKPAAEQLVEKPAKITLELEVGNDKIIKMRLKDKVIQLAE